MCKLCGIAPLRLMYFNPNPPLEDDTHSFPDSFMYDDNRPCYLTRFHFYTRSYLQFHLHDALYPTHFKLDKAGLTNNDLEDQLNQINKYSHYRNCNVKNKLSFDQLKKSLEKSVHRFVVWILKRKICANVA